jgi:Flp pilus assembly protein TadD
MLGDLRGAIAAYSKAIQIKPDYAEAYFNRGVVKEMKRDSNGAFRDWEKASELEANGEMSVMERELPTKIK